MTDSVNKSMRVNPSRSLRAWLRDPSPQSPFQAHMQLLWIQWRRFCANHSALFGLLVLLIIAGAAVFAPWLATHDIYAQNLAFRLQPFSAEHWLGTDEL